MVGTRSYDRCPISYPKSPNAMVSLKCQRKRSADLCRRNKADRREPSAYIGPQSAASGGYRPSHDLTRCFLTNFVPESGLSYQVPFGGWLPPVRFIPPKGTWQLRPWFGGIFEMFG